MQGMVLHTSSLLGLAAELIKALLSLPDLSRRQVDALHIANLHHTTVIVRGARLQVISQC